MTANGIRDPAHESENQNLVDLAAGANPFAAVHRRERIDFWNARARAREPWGPSAAYHRRLAQVYSSLIVPGQRVLEIGCGRGNLLAAVRPAEGVGIDFSEHMLDVARCRHDGAPLRFIRADAHELPVAGRFDAIILSDLINDLWDVEAVFTEVRRLCGPGTRLILNFYSRIWELPLTAASKLGMATPLMPQNWLTPPDVANLLTLGGFEVIRRCHEILLPLKLPLFDPFCNRVLAKLWPFSAGAMTNFMVARPLPLPGDAGDRRPSVSVIVPARNESGNIPAIFARVPEMGAGTELIFVEGGSEDGTYSAIEESIAQHPQRRCQLFRQAGKGKGDAVRLGFSRANGELLMILDADLTVAPEDLPRFYRAIHSQKGDFINGVRLVYPMEQRAMRPANLAGNKFFSLAFSWLLGQPIKDTLCGTKVLWRRDYDLIAANRKYFGDFDPFGDFDLLFGAARINLKIVDLPIRYRQRTYGKTNIRRWAHGWLLLRMCAFAATRIKFV